MHSTATLPGPANAYISRNHQRTVKGSYSRMVQNFRQTAVSLKHKCARFLSLKMLNTMSMRQQGRLSIMALLKAAQEVAFAAPSFILLLTRATQRGCEKATPTGDIKPSSSWQASATSRACCLRRPSYSRSPIHLDPCMHNEKNGSDTAFEQAYYPATAEAYALTRG